MSERDLGLRREALRHMFRLDIDAAYAALNQYASEHPKDAMVYALKAAVAFYHTVSLRMPEGPRETLRKVILGSGIPFPTDQRKALENDLGRARAYAAQGQPEDLLALAIVEGVKRDYLALVCKKWFDSFESARKAAAHARLLLKIDPAQHDACFVLAMTEYMVHRIPAILRPFAPIDGIRGDRAKAIRYCETVIESGNYFQEFARRLLVDLYLDEGRRQDAYYELKVLADEYPGNIGIAKDLKRIAAGR